ncbi:branched-chain amino acid ABC transporter permease [Amycolatopsis thermophila]|uniref:Branched-chain amino acid transport system permease protein n=1 Tax=Amycolatopsis thermophila TaxID=206084 RepID=A0ABU0F157_9PSEU|nr:branched-chain amino acid ABC transporter permease [Amycolatopsis thermophila]MDQ0381084.1 branched-chain amino acid transport system permease protein [Amycolatopsis thermophila]
MAAVTIEEGSRAHRSLRWGTAAIGAALLVVLPLVIGDVSQIETLTQMVAYSVAILGLGLLTGHCGQISLGHSAFVGLGAYTTIILVADHNWPYLATIPVSVVICLLAGALVGVPALRIRGLYLATVTLAVAALFPVLVDKFPSFTGGPNGKFAPHEMAAPDWFFVDPYTVTGPATDHYYAVLAVAGLMFLVAANIVRGRVGRAMHAVRDAPLSAAASGIRVARVKIFAFAVSAAFAGVAGSLLVIQVPAVSDSRFDLYLSIFLLVALIAGGSGSILGAIPGAVIFVVLRTYMADWAESLDLLGGRPDGGQIVGIASGALLIAFVFLLPGGVVDGLGKLRRRVLEIVPRPPRGWEAHRFPVTDRSDQPTLERA